MNILKDRHDRGWPKVQLLTFIVQMDRSERFCIEPMGYRDGVWERSGYVELIRWVPFRDIFKADFSSTEKNDGG